MNGPPVDVVAFDINETTFSLDRLRPAFTAIGLDPGSVPLWFARVLRDGFCLTVVGAFAHFNDIAAEQLHALSPHLIDKDVDTVMAAFHELDPYPDTESALVMLREAGVRVVTLTNGSASWITRLLQRANLASQVEHNLSIDAVRKWKPAREVYLYAAEVTQTPANRVALVSAHALDCDGARRAGLRTGRVNRHQTPQPRHFLPADVQGHDLPTTIQRLLSAD
jgi:2-haloacid dehalogenase